MSLYRSSKSKTITLLNLIHAKSKLCFCGKEVLFVRMGGPLSLTLAVVTSTSPPGRVGARPAGPARRTAGT